MRDEGTLVGVALQRAHQIVHVVDLGLALTLLSPSERSPTRGSSPRRERWRPRKRRW